MPHASPIQNSFNAGEMSPKLEGRTDLAKYAAGCSILENFVPQVQGPAVKRSGFRFAMPSYLSGRLVPFEFNVEQAYVLSFENRRMKVLKDGGGVLESTVSITGATKADPCVITANTHGYSDGDEVYLDDLGGMEEINGRYFVVDNADTNTFELLNEDSSGYTTYTSGGTTARVVALRFDSEISISAITKAYPAKVTTSSAHGLVDGDVIYIDDGGDMTEVNDSYFTAITVDSTNFYLDGIDSTGYTAYTSGGAMMRIPFPYTSAVDDLYHIYYAQSADTLFLAHPDYAPRAITRTSHTSWSCDVIAFDWPPFNPVPDNEITLVCDDIAPGAGATLTASASLFSEDDVGRIIRIGLHEGSGEHPDSYQKFQTGGAVFATSFSGTGDSDQVQYDGNVYVCSNNSTDGRNGGSAPRHRTYLQEVFDGPETTPDAGWTYLHSGWGYVEITGYTSATEVTVEVIKELPVSGDYHTTAGVPDSAHVATLNWSWGAWDSTSGYPSVVAFHEDRLWWGSTDAKPQTLWGSRVGDYYNHEYWDSDDWAMLVTINTDRVNAIRWMSSGVNLSIGTSGGEFIAKSSSADEPITPSTIEITRHSTLGSREGVMPIQVENVVLFSQRSGRRLRELVYEFDTDSYVAPDLSVLADHLLHGQIEEMCFQQEPNRVLWVVLNDGGLVGLTYDRAQEVVGWHRVVLGGSLGSGDPQVKSAAVIPHLDGGHDQLWVMVRRTIGGSIDNHIEYLEADWNEDDDDEDAFFVDSGLTYDGAAATDIIGLNHLEGEAVDVLADGSVVTGHTVSGGKITLASAASVVQVGLNYVAKLGTMRVEAGAADGTSQGKTKRIIHLIVRCFQVGAGLRYGAKDDSSEMEEMALRDTYDIMGTPADWFDGDSEKLYRPWGYEQPAKVILHHYKPTPCTITALMPRVETEDD